MDEKECTKCKKTKPLNEFHTERSGPRTGKPTSWCKACSSEHSKKYYAENTEKAKEAHKKWASKNRYKIKLHKIKSTFGLEPHEYEAMPKVCVICGSTEKLCVDHSHRSGRIRGLLCQRCNRGLGDFRDDPTLLLRASDYLFGFATPEIFSQTYEKVK